VVENTVHIATLLPKATCLEKELQAGDRPSSPSSKTCTTTNILSAVAVHICSLKVFVHFTRGGASRLGKSFVASY